MTFFQTQLRTAMLSAIFVNRTEEKTKHIDSKILSTQVGL